MKTFRSNKSLWVVVLVCIALGVFFFVQKDFTNMTALLVAVVVAVLGAILQALFQQGSPEPHSEGLQSNVGWFSDFKKQYFSFLRYQNRDFDIKGLSTQTIHTLDLEQVFVELHLQPQPVHLASSDPLGHISIQNIESHNVWWYLDIIEAQQATGAKVAIIGAPGSGKTTLLRHMAFILASTWRSRQKTTKNKRIPVSVDENFEVA